MENFQFELGALVVRLDFLIAYASGLIILVLFCMERFNEPANDEGSFVASLVPRTFSSGFDYIKTFVIYVVVLVTIYTGFSLVGTYLFTALFVTDPTGYSNEAHVAVADLKEALSPQKVIIPAWVPLAILLFLTGGATHFKILNQVELFARRATHRLIGIPHDVERLAENIRDRRINLADLGDLNRKFVLARFNELSRSETDDIGVVERFALNNNPVRLFLRLSFLHYLIENRDLPSGFVREKIQEHKEVWDSIGNTVRYVRSSPEISRVLLTIPSELDEADQERRSVLSQRVEKDLHNLHALIAICVSPVRGQPAKIDEVMQALKLRENKIEDLSRHRLDRVVLALVVLFLGVLGGVFLLKDDPLQAFNWAVGASFLHGAAALSAWRIWEQRNRRNRWSPLNFHAGAIPALQYLGVATRGYIYGLVALFLWYSLYHLVANRSLPTLSMELIWIPAYSFIGIMTAFWVAYDFDVVHREHTQQGRKIVQVVLQTATTAAIAYYITITLQSMAADVDSQKAQILSIEVAIATAIAAGILGFIATFMSKNLAAQKIETG